MDSFSRLLLSMLRYSVTMSRTISAAVCCSRKARPPALFQALRCRGRLRTCLFGASFSEKRFQLFGRSSPVLGLFDLAEEIALDQARGRNFFEHQHRIALFQTQTAVLKFSCAELSAANAKRVPICTPSAPRAMTASIPAPVAMPPAAISGSEVARRTAGIRHKVVVSSRPL